jgi:hypothetical protein
MELIFLLSFSLHNIEEGLWLPGWSKYAGKYHPQVSKHEFHFALMQQLFSGDMRLEL